MTDANGRRIGLIACFLSAALVIFGLVVLLLWMQMPTTPLLEPVNMSSAPGPVAPIPRIEDHVAAVAQRDCVERQECLTRDSLKRVYGIDIVCAEERYTGRQTNPSSAVAHVPCSRITELKMNGQSVWKGR